MNRLPRDLVNKLAKDHLSAANAQRLKATSKGLKRNVPDTRKSHMDAIRKHQEAVLEASARIDDLEEQIQKEYNSFLDSSSFKSLRSTLLSILTKDISSWWFRSDKNIATGALIATQLGKPLANVAPSYYERLIEKSSFLPPAGDYANFTAYAIVTDDRALAAVLAVPPLKKLADLNKRWQAAKKERVRNEMAYFAAVDRMGSRRLSIYARIAQAGTVLLTPEELNEFLDENEVVP